MKKFYLTILIVLMFALMLSALTFSYASSPVVEAVNTTNVKILGVTITTRVDLSVVLSHVDGEISGHASFANGVLTLDNVRIQFVNSETPVVEATNGDLRITCVGENDLNNSFVGSQVIKLGNGALTLLGDGSLRIVSSSTPIYVSGGDVTFECRNVYLSNEFSSVWLNGSNFARFNKGSRTKIYGGVRAISNLSGDSFNNEKFDKACSANAGQNEDADYPIDEYIQQKYLFVYTKAVLTCENNTFDKYNPNSITVTIELNGNLFTGISGLSIGTHYSQAGNTITLFENNFAGRSIGNRDLMFQFNVGDGVNFVVQIVDTTPTTSVSLSVTEARYDADYAPTIFTIISQPAKFVSVSGLGPSDYVYDYSNGYFQINEAYLEGLPNNVYTFVFSFSGGAMSRSFKLTVVNSAIGEVVNPPTGLDSQIYPTFAIFDKFTTTSNYAPIVVTIAFNGNSLLSIKNGLNTISPKSYSRLDDRVTIELSYFKSLAVGDYTLTFEFSDGEPQILSLMVKNTDPLPNNKTPYYDDPLFRMDIPGLGNGNTTTPTEPEDGVITPPIELVGDGGTGAMVVVGIIGGVTAISFVVWIILRKKRIV